MPLIERLANVSSSKINKEVDFIYNYFCQIRYTIKTFDRDKV